MDDTRAVFQAVLEAQQRGEAAALATVIRTQGSVPRHPGSKMLVRADGSFVGTVGGGAMEGRVIALALRVIRSGTAETGSYALNDIGAGDPGVCGGSIEVFVEPLTVAPQLVVIGMGHVGKALAELAKWADFRVVVCDDRAEMCTPEAVPGMDQYVVCKPSDVAAHMRIDAHTYVAAVTRGLPVDIGLIPALLQTDAAYIGLIGSRRRWALTVKALEAEYGLRPSQLSRVIAPIGLELQAETPKEIAVSILAQIIMHRRGGSGQPMQWMGAPEEADAPETPR